MSTHCLSEDVVRILYLCIQSDVQNRAGCKQDSCNRQVVEAGGWRKRHAHNWDKGKDAKYEGYIAASQSRIQ